MKIRVNEKAGFSLKGFCELLKVLCCVLRLSESSVTIGDYVHVGLWQPRGLWWTQDIEHQYTKGVDITGR